MDPQLFGQPQGDTAAPSAEAIPQAPVAEQGVPSAAVAPDSGTQDATVAAEARERELREEARRNAERAKELEGQLTQVGQAFQTIQQQQQQQAESERYDKWWSDALENSQSMTHEEQARYLNAERRKIDAEKTRQFQQQLSRAEAEKRQVAEYFGRPRFVDKYVKEHGLDEEDRVHLESLQNMDDVARVAPLLAQRRKEISEINERLNQLSRAGQAQQMQAAGLGTVGGVVPPGSAPSMPDDPDDRALHILHYGTGS